MVPPITLGGIRAVVEHACAVSRVGLAIAAGTNAMSVQRSFVIDGVSLLRAAIPHIDSLPPPRWAGAQGGAGLRPWRPCRCTRQCSDQGCAFIAISNS